MGLVVAVCVDMGLAMGLVVAVCVGLEEVFVFDSKSENRVTCRVRAGHPSISTHSSHYRVTCRVRGGHPGRVEQGYV